MGVMSAAFFAALAAVALAPLCRRMAAPYAAPARAVPAQVASFYPGDANGSQFVNVDDSRLLQAQRLFEGEIQGPESVAVSADGNRLVLLDRFGYVRVAQRGREGYKLEAEAFYMGPGRPLGFALLEHDAWADAELIVCDSLKGLVRVRPFGSILARMEVLTNVDEDSLPFFYANDVAVRGSKMYFTSSTNVSVLLRDEAYDTMGAYLLNALSGQQDGRLLVYDVETRTTKTLVRGIAYANGVAVSADGAFVAFAETDLARVRRHYLSGPKRGETDTLVEGLPGMPDGISQSGDGGFWVALVAPLSPLLKLLAPYPRIRTLLSHVVLQVYPLFAKPWGGVIRLDSTGNVVDALFDATGTRVASVSSVTEQGGRLFLANLHGNSVSLLAVY
mmetsp:Transcript_26715/g.89871  ORF Transcript_26715/g.89871 Transcript_26715/m.89871 type:complete len:390 (-) Transcript_26715:37-1206(-)